MKEKLTADNLGKQPSFGGAAGLPKNSGHSDQGSTGPAMNPDNMHSPFGFKGVGGLASKPGQSVRATKKHKLTVSNIETAGGHKYKGVGGMSKPLSHKHTSHHQIAH